MCLRVSYEKKYGKKFFFSILEVSEEMSRIRSWIRIRQSEVKIQMSRAPNTDADNNSVSCHGRSS